jgi:hypothetical protein
MDLVSPWGTDRTTLLSFSVTSKANQHHGMGQQTIIEALTDVEHIAPSACI